MIPVGSDFIAMYVIYTVLFLVIGYVLIFLRKRKLFWVHFGYFVLYFGFMLYLFSDKDNFRGGGSLVVLFYGWLLPGFHLIICIIAQVYGFFEIKLRNK